MGYPPSPVTRRKHGVTLFGRCGGGTHCNLGRATVAGWIGAVGLPRQHRVLDGTGQGRGVHRRPRWSWGGYLGRCPVLSWSGWWPIGVRGSRGWLG